MQQEQEGKLYYMPQSYFTNLSRERNDMPILHVAVPFLDREQVKLNSMASSRDVGNESQGTMRRSLNQNLLMVKQEYSNNVQSETRTVELDPSNDSRPMT